MLFKSSYENVQRRASHLPTDHALPNYFNASLIIRVPIQPVRYAHSLLSCSICLQITLLQ